MGDVRLDIGEIGKSDWLAVRTRSRWAVRAPLCPWPHIRVCDQKGGLVFCASALRCGCEVEQLESVAMRAQSVHNRGKGAWQGRPRPQLWHRCAFV